MSLTGWERIFGVALACEMMAAAGLGQTVVPSGSGVTATGGGHTLRVDALKADVLRVRMYPDGAMPEDASWAVLPESRTARVKVIATASGFSTGVLTVSISADLKLKVTDAAGKVVQEDAVPVGWEPDGGFYVKKVATPEDHFFGLGDKPGPLDRLNQSFVMWNTDNFGWQATTDPIYKSVPFFIEMREGRALGVLFDNTFRAFFDFGHEAQDRYAFSAPAGPLDYYLIHGPEPKQVVEEYAWLTGPTPMPPLWTLGFQQSRYSYFPRARLEEVADRLRKDRIPSDALYLDIDYQDKNRPFTTDPVGYPDFAGLMHKLAAEQFHVVAITDLHIAHMPGQGYMPYDTGEAGDHFVKLHGQEYVGPVWPGPSVFPEFTRAETRKWWGGLYKEFVKDGVAGFWNDMNEPAVFTDPYKTMPDEVEHRIDEPGFEKRTATHKEIHNIFGMENSRGTYEGLLALESNVRPFVLTRASYAGGQRYSATWTGDNSSTWDHLRQTTPQLLNLGLSGFAMAGADVGGFAGSPPADLLTRWTMLATFQPIDRNHSAKGTRDHEVWVDGPEQEAIRKRYIEERYRLMPYLYTTAEEMTRTGLPIVRPLFLEFPHATPDGRPMDLSAGGEFMFGPDILVADSPSPEEVAPYEVHLPPGVWYDYWTGERLDRRAPVVKRDMEIREAPVAALKPVMVQPKADELPVYVRAGAIVPMMPLVQSTEEKPDGPLTLRVFPGDGCRGDLYQDDGKSFDFRKGEFLRVKMMCSVASDGSVTVAIRRRDGLFKPWWNEVKIEMVGFVPKSGTDGEKTALGWAKTVKDEGKGLTVVFR